MKKQFFSKLFWGIFLIAIMGVYVSCNQPDPVLQTNNEQEGESLNRIAIIPVPRLDLVITSYTTNVTSTTTSCGGTLPNVSCFGGGQRSFTSTVTVTNNGPAALPAGSLQVLWADLTLVNSQTQTVTHGGIPAGGSLLVSRPYYMGPCGCVPPPTFFTHSFNATVDPNNLIPETNNGNNTSPTYTACDGC